MNLSPPLLKAQLVRGRTWALSVLNGSKCWTLLDSILSISSAFELILKKEEFTPDQGFQVRLFGLGDYWLFVKNFIHQLVHIGPAKISKFKENTRRKD
jgi:hypothetical protein